MTMVFNHYGEFHVVDPIKYFSGNSYTVNRDNDVDIRIQKRPVFENGFTYDDYGVPVEKPIVVEFEIAVKVRHDVDIKDGRNIVNRRLNQIFNGTNFIKFWFDNDYLYRGIKLIDLELSSTNEKIYKDLVGRFSAYMSNIKIRAVKQTTDGIDVVLQSKPKVEDGEYLSVSSVGIAKGVKLDYTRETNYVREDSVVPSTPTHPLVTPDNINEISNNRIERKIDQIRKMNGKPVIKIGEPWTKPKKFMYLTNTGGKIWSDSDEWREVIIDCEGNRKEKMIDLKEGSIITNYFYTGTSWGNGDWIIFEDLSYILESEYDEKVHTKPVRTRLKSSGNSTRPSIINVRMDENTRTITYEEKSTYRNGTIFATESDLSPLVDVSGIIYSPYYIPTKSEKYIKEVKYSEKSGIEVVWSDAHRHKKFVETRLGGFHSNYKYDELYEDHIPIKSLLPYYNDSYVEYNRNKLRSTYFSEKDAEVLFTPPHVPRKRKPKEDDYHDLLDDYYPDIAEDDDKLESDSQERTYDQNKNNLKIVTRLQPIFDEVTTPHLSLLYNNKNLEVFTESDSTNIIKRLLELGLITSEQNDALWTEYGYDLAETKTFLRVNRFAYDVFEHSDKTPVTPKPLDPKDSPTQLVVSDKVLSIQNGDRVVLHNLIGTNMTSSTKNEILSLARALNIDYTDEPGFGWVEVKDRLVKEGYLEYKSPNAIKLERIDDIYENGGVISEAPTPEDIANGELYKEHVDRNYYLKRRNVTINTDRFKPSKLNYPIATMDGKLVSDYPLQWLDNANIAKLPASMQEKVVHMLVGNIAELEEYGHPVLESWVGRKSWRSVMDLLIKYGYLIKFEYKQKLDMTDEEYEDLKRESYKVRNPRKKKNNKENSEVKQLEEYSNKKPEDILKDIAKKKIKEVGDKVDK